MRRNLMHLTSFYTALTGLNSNSLAINVIGDNLANLNTTAFKSSQASFSELLSGLSGTSSTGNPISFGLGSTLNGIDRLCTQGTINHTGTSTDAAINGNGFFVVSTEGGIGYTRAGKFQFDKDGRFISSDGYQVMGYMAVNGQMNTSGALVPIDIRKGQIIAPTATSNMGVMGTLNAEAPDNSSFSSSIQIYDSMGAAHNVTLTFTKTSAGVWSWTATIPAEDTGGVVGGTPTTIGSGNLQFDSLGKLISPTTNPTVSITGLANGAADMTINFNLLDSKGNPNISSYAMGSQASSPAGSVNYTTQDGFPSSILQDISIDSDGTIVGLTENGQSIALAQLALADFPNVEGLEKYKGSTFVAFTSSGEPSIGVAGSGGRGTIVGASLEQSNVDMAQEFINLIVAQRAYQANSRVITTTDELYQDSLSLKR
jgi:flagellar hook protein FlgE